jgi:3-dehydroquinate dehydratase / shikimate dehydrogenase
MESSPKTRVCISICEPTLEALRRAITNCDNCDLIEIRLDCLEPSELKSAADSITQLLRSFSGEAILTLRPWGQAELDLDTRLAFWSAAIFSESFFDVELDLAEHVVGNETSPSFAIDWSHTICSHHDFEGVPAGIDQIYERLSATPARVLKIAAQANDVTDCLPFFQLLERAHADGRLLISLAMGPAGVMTRVLGPSRGAFLTYAPPDDGLPTAPGQISRRELTDVYRIQQLDQQTQVFGLVGLPVSHSVSPHLQNAAFAAAGLNAVYLPFETKNVEAFLKRMVHPRTRELNLNIRGLSVTAPHKLAVMPHLDWLEPAAAAIGAVNTIVIKDDSLLGYNTDAYGFIQPLSQKFGDLRDAKCAVIGSGGAASAALWALQHAGAAITVFSRNAAKAGELAQKFGAKKEYLDRATFAGFDVVVNATPLGSAGGLATETAATVAQLRGARLAYDLVYNPIETRFLREARAAGCEVLGGLSMLVEQAKEQFKLWTGTIADASVMRQAAERKLAES